MTSAYSLSGSSTSESASPRSSPSRGGAERSGALASQLTGTIYYMSPRGMVAR